MAKMFVQHDSGYCLMPYVRFPYTSLYDWRQHLYGWLHISRWEWDLCLCLCQIKLSILSTQTWRENWHSIIIVL